MMEVTKFTIDDDGINRLLFDRAGPVGRDLDRRAAAVEAKARENASGRPGPNPRTDRLRQSIRRVVGNDGGGLFADIGSDEPHSVYMEKGTTAHVIQSHGDYPLRSEPGHPDPLLAPRPIVHHPGNKPYPFLQPALEAFKE